MTYASQCALALLFIVSAACTSAPPDTSGASPELQPVAGAETCTRPGPAQANASGTIVVLGCSVFELARIDGAAQTIGDPRDPFVSAFAWLDEGQVVAGNTDPRLDSPSESARSGVFSIIDVSTGRARIVRLSRPMPVGYAYQMTVLDPTHVIAPIHRTKTPFGKLTDLALIDLETSTFEWLTQTEDLDELAAIPVPGGLLVAVETVEGRAWMQFLPDDGSAPVKVASKIRVDTLQVVGDDIVIGGSPGTGYGSFNVFSAPLSALPGSLPLTEVYAGPGRWPFVEADGDTMLLTLISASPFEPGQLVRVPIDLTAS